MKIAAPALPPRLPGIDNLSAVLHTARAEERDIAEWSITDETLTYENLCGVYFKGVVFEGCRFTGTRAVKGSYSDVIFRSCDLSNADFSDGFFNRCEFISCKLVGTNFGSSRLQNISVEDCSCKYAILDKSNISETRLFKSDFFEAGFSECKLKNISLCDVIFTRGVFFKTPLKGLDFTDCEIDGITVSDTGAELRGMKVSTLQAAELAKRMGIIVV